MNYRVIYAGDEAVEQAVKLFKHGITSHDSMPRLVNDHLDEMRDAINQYDPDLIILEHPWMIDLTDGRPFVYDAHNCESIATAQRVGRQSLDFDLVHELEHDAISEAEHVIYCAEQDWHIICNTWDDHAEGTWIPNGTHIPRKPINNKNRNLVFVGSNYLPNVYAAHNLASIAHLLPEYDIHLVGASSLGVETTQPNVTRWGHVTDDQLHHILSNAHIFVNLIDTGSGTHLKIPQALAYGIPVLTTPVGSRGYETDVNICTNINQVPDMIRTITSKWQQHSNMARHNAHKYDWANIRRQYQKAINALQ